jgi:hypothetical protein
LGMSDTVAGSLRSRLWGDTPSIKGHVNPFGPQAQSEVRVYLPPWAGIAVLILIFCEHSVGSPRTAWFGIYRCIERMAIRPVSQTLGTRATALGARSSNICRSSFRAASIQMDNSMRLFLTSGSVARSASCRHSRALREISSLRTITL